MNRLGFFLHFVASLSDSGSTNGRSVIGTGHSPPGMSPAAAAQALIILNWVSQIWPFAHEIKQGDLVFLPLKTQSTIYISEMMWTM